MIEFVSTLLRNNHNPAGVIFILVIIALALLACLTEPIVRRSWIMPVTFSVAKVVDYEKNFPSLHDGEDESWNTTTENVVNRMLSCGIRQITAENASKVYERFKSLQLAVEWPVQDLTLDIVRKHIGLTTNITPKNDSSFYKEIGKIIHERAVAQRGIEDATNGGAYANQEKAAV